MTSVNKLTSVGISLVILAIFLASFLMPTLGTLKLQTDDIYKTDKDGNIIVEGDYKQSEYPDLKPIVVKPAIKLPGAKAINAMIDLIPLFFAFGGLYIIYKAFYNKE